MLAIKSIALSFKDRVLYDHISFSINKGEKIGFTGRNGAGKSTLMKIITGELKADSGSIDKPTGSTIGYLHQDLSIPKNISIKGETYKAFEQINALEQRLEGLQNELNERTDYESDEYMNLVTELSAISERLGMLGVEKMEAEAEKILCGLGFQREDFDKDIGTFSGGWQMRVILAKMLLQRPDFLLLDEPTNHLDIESILWLEKFLKDYEGAVVLISHDRTFLDTITQRTIEVELGKIYDYPCNYSRYLLLREERLTLARSSFNNQQKVIAEKEKTIKRFMAKATKTKMAQSMQKQLDKMERIELDEPSLKSMKLRFPEPPRSGLVLAELVNVGKNYGDKKVLSGVDFKIERGDRIAFVGQNGQGKTTLAKIILGETPYSNGQYLAGSAVEIGYYAQNQSESFHGDDTLLDTIQKSAPTETDAKLRSVLGAFLFSGDDVHKKVKVLSGGERARLALACLILKPINFLVLDEPTNHLDMVSKDILKDAIQQFKGTLLVVSHDRDFLKSLTTKIVEFRDNHIKEYMSDIDAYLESRSLESMREVELRNKTNPNTSEKSGQDQQRKKEVAKKLSSVEQKITKLETEIETLEKSLSQPEGLGGAEQSRLLSLYDQKKRDLSLLNQEWEELVDAQS
jgi:ATP-binding cassette, subfamily F, member 3